MADKRVKELPPRDLAAFFESLAMLLRAGVPANECAEIVAADVETGRLAGVLRTVAGILSGGEVYIFSQAIQQSGAFPRYAVEMMRLGEDSGRLEATAEALGEYYRRQETLRQSIRSAVSGPVLLMAMMSVVLIFLISFVLPVFRGVYLSLARTQEADLGGVFTVAYVAMAVVGALLVLLLAVGLAYLLPGGKQRLAGFAQVLPVTRRLHYAMSAGRFTSGLAMLLASGISVGEAVEKAAVLVNNKRIAKKIPGALAEVNQGEDLGKTLVKHDVLDGFEAKILLSAARAGQTEAAMRNLSGIYLSEADAGIERLLGMIEPALVGVLSVAIGVILLSVMLPLTGILSAPI